MIPRIVCFIFGHKRQHKKMANSTVDLPTAMIEAGFYRYNVEHYKKCPRCGAKL